MADEFEEILQKLRSKIVLSEEIVTIAKHNFSYLSHIQSYTQKERIVGSLLSALRSSDCMPISQKMFFNMFCDENGADGLWGYSYRNVMKINVLLHRELDTKTKPCYTNPLMYIKSICERVHIGKRIYGLAMRIANQAVNKKVHVGRNPVVIAAGCVYIAVIQKGVICSQREIAEAANITEVSVRNCAIRLRLRLGLENS